MEDQNIQTQINELNHKMDLILDNVNQQRLKAEAVEDLVKDLSLVGKDIYDSSVEELENQQVSIDPDALKIIVVKLIKNIENIGNVISLFESANDLIKDAGPIVNEVIIEATKKLHVFEQKGYFEFFAAFGDVVDNIVTNFSKDDVTQLAENISTILQTVKNLTQPEMLDAVNNAVKVYQSMEVENVPEYSVWKLMREMNKPEMKKALGFAVTFLKNIANQPKA
ncbi:MAG: hypothetical protein C0599_03345 [Salinivirgaceae bacterium]|nr:MAG: hypothetical protein C0599_03345 [Salinivirgaceae bacterium]